MATTYDEIPYSSHPFAQTHPDRLATVATILGLQPPELDRARILELGCASGGNLIPIAESMPGTQCVGVDFSERQIADGNKVIERLKLPNVQLLHRNILEMGTELGTFDYIICHGVFSWVPRPVQEKIFAICHEQLSPRGVGYISYNTLPGWRMRGMIRDMMLYHARQFSSPKQQIEQAIALIDFLSSSSAAEKTPYSTFLQSQLEYLRKVSGSYIFHEYLEADNDPVYFHEFVARASAHGLRYLGEADVANMVPGRFAPEVQQTLARLSADQIHLEQYLDFLYNRFFRQTLVCHSGLEPDYRLNGSRVAGMYVASAGLPASAQPDLSAGKPEQFKFANDLVITSTEPVVKAALLVLSESWPRRIAFSKLCSAARSRLPASLQEANGPAQTAQLVGQAVLQFYTSATNLVDLSVRPLDPVGKPSERPSVGRLTRLLAEQGPNTTNLRHETIGLGPFERELVMRLDGTRDRATLTREMEALVRNGTLNVTKDGKPVTAEGPLHAALAEAVDKQLEALGRHSLYVA